MRSIRRVGGLAVAGILLSAVASGPAASAASPAGYIGIASGYALKLTLANQGLTAGSSVAKAASDGTGSAEGTGGVSPLGIQGQAKASNPPPQTVPETCAVVLPPAALGAVPVDIGLGCGQASATGTGAESVASATGMVAGIGVDLNTVLTQIPVTAPITSTLTTVLTSICAGIPDSPLKPVGCAVTNEVQALAQSLAATQTLNGDIGSSTSGVSVAGSTVTSESTASGAVIRLLPNATLNGVPIGEPLVTITVARANAKVICDLGSGNAVPSFDPAIVRVKFSNPLAAILPNLATDQLPTIALPAAVGAIATGTPIDPTVALTNGELTVTPGSTVVLFPGTPIQTEIVVGAGSSKVNPDRSASAVADGVKIHALQNIGTVAAPLTGGLLANLAHAEASAGCVSAVSDVASPPTPNVPTFDLPRELPRTGGTPWLPMAGAAGLALAVLARRAISRNS